MLPAVKKEYIVEILEDAVISDLNNSGAFIVDIKLECIDDTSNNYVYCNRYDYNAEIFSLIPTTINVTITWSQDNIDGKIHETVTKTIVHVV